MARPADHVDEMSEQRPSLELTSPAFDDGGIIPRKYGRDQADVNPPLRIEGVPDEAESLALLVEDPDAKAVAGHVWTHWLVYHMDPGRREIPEDWDSGDAELGRTDFDEFEYGGPSPPSGEHTYVFRLYALDTEVALFDNPTATDLRESVEGHVVETAELRGRYPADW